VSERIPVGIIGLGMVGMPVRRWFEEIRGYRRGHDLFCYDTDPKLACFDDVGQARVVFVCVPTPPNPDGSCNTSIVESVVSRLPEGRIVVIKSTVPPGTTDGLQAKHPALKLMFCPEFLTESQAWTDFIRPSRQLIGVTDRSAPHSIEVLGLLPPALFQRPDTPIYGGRETVTAAEAEMAKYVSNVFGALKVVYANIIADMTWLMTRMTPSVVDYEHVRAMVAADLRIGASWMNVDYGDYAGFGGYCFPKDTAAFIWLYEKLIADFHHEVTLHPYLGTLQAGLGLLKAAYEYNRQLLQAQGLTIEDVSVHDRELILHKKRPIRN
jgi:UDPglucose 6-dehydrogenase